MAETQELVPLWGGLTFTLDSTLRSIQDGGGFTPVVEHGVLADGASSFCGDAAEQHGHTIMTCPSSNVSSFVRISCRKPSWDIMVADNFHTNASVIRKRGVSFRMSFRSRGALEMVLINFF